MTLTTSDVRPATAATAAPTRNVRVLRAICIAGKRVEPGTDMTLYAWLAMQLVGSGQAVLVADAHHRACADAGIRRDLTDGRRRETLSAKESFGRRQHFGPGLVTRRGPRLNVFSEHVQIMT